MTTRLQPLKWDVFANLCLIATDMDGTLTQQGKFTPALLQAFTDLFHAGIQVLIVTGRSAGWVQAVVNYLPVAGAIAENGGVVYWGDASKQGVGELLVPIPEIKHHRQQLAEMFYQLQQEFPQIQESTDNPFRITDWTFDVQGLTPEELDYMSDRCHSQGWGFTYSTVQCHIKSLQQDKAIGLLQVLKHHFPSYTSEQVVTVGDSPNDESLFDPQYFPVSVGVANVLHYVDRLHHQPVYVTQAAEGEGFCELAQCLIQARG